MPLSVQRFGVLFYRSASPFVEKKVGQKLQVEKIGTQMKNSADYLKSTVTCALYYPENVSFNV